LNNYVISQLWFFLGFSKNFTFSFLILVTCILIFKHDPARTLDGGRYQNLLGLENTGVSFGGDMIFVPL